VKEIFAHPVFGPMLFDRGWVVGFWKFFWHGNFRVTKPKTTADKSRELRERKNSNGRDTSSAVVCAAALSARTGSAYRGPSFSCSH
jgi:hypothetical protein